MKKIIYVLTKLFNINDRKAGLRLNNILCEWINKKELFDYEECFLPYRDSNEKVKGMKNKTLEIFKMDCRTIENASALVGYCDGPIYDSGIGFEIGYALVNAVPVILLTTDYFYVEIENRTFSISPLAEKITTIIHERENPKFKGDYKEGLSDVEDRVLGRLKKELNVISKSCNNIYDISPALNRKKVYIDISFKLNEMHKKFLEELKLFLYDSNISYYIASSTDIDTNLQYLNGCKIVLIWGDEFDFNFDSAIIQGISYGLKKNIILYSSSPTRYYQCNDFILYKNPMIEHSAKIVFDKTQLYKEIAEADINKY